MLSKITVQPFPHKFESRASEILELVYTDVYGPFSTRSLGGNRYFLTIIDDKSHRILVSFLKGEDKVFSKFVEFKELVKRQTGKLLKCIQSDNGKNMATQSLKIFLKRMGSSGS